MHSLKLIYFFLLIFCLLSSSQSFSHPGIIIPDADNIRMEKSKTDKYITNLEIENPKIEKTAQQKDAVNIPVNEKASQKKPIYIAIIIDDLGYKTDMDNRAVNLPGKLTYAFLPHAPLSHQLAEKVYRQDREVMLHLPMQSHEHIHLGPGAITSGMNEAEFNQTLQESLASVPHVKGLNNHMGSLITSDEEKMNWLMKNIALKDLFFIDSRTTIETVAETVANQYQIPNTRRNVFLDHYHTAKDIEKQFNRLIKLAKKYGSAVGIAHPFELTLRILEKKLPELEKQGIQLISASEIIAYQQNQGEKSWQMSLSHSQKVVKNSKPLPSSTCCEELKSQ